MNNYLNIINWQERLQQLNGKRVSLYGAGKYGKIALNNIKKYLPQLEIVCFLDDNLIRNSGNVEEVPVVTLEEAIKRYGDFNILITNYYVSSVLNNIEKIGFDINKVFFWSELLIGDIDNFIFEKHKNYLSEVYNNLDDYISKMIYRNVIESRYWKKTDLLSLTCEKDQYFPTDIFKLGEEEVFVDAGAYDGDTIEAFLKITGQKYKYIYAFEPDYNNYSKLLERGYEKNIQIYNAGLFCENKKMSFSANKGGSSKIEEQGTSSIQVLKFDDLEVPDNNITFVKMDIEGSELTALRGMEKTIKMHKPKLAICIYHNFEDLWELPLYIKCLVPEYKLYIRNYTSYLDEIVLYAVI